MSVVIRVLGWLEVEVGGRAVRVTGPRLRTVLALLVADAGRVVGVGALADGLWGGAAPPDAARTVRTYVSRLRTLGLAGLIVTRPPGYLLHIPADAVDAARFERLADAGRRALAEGRVPTAATLLAGALSLWRDTPYAEFPDTETLRGEARRLDRVRQAAIEDRLAAELAGGRGAALLPELQTLTTRHPERERLWAMLMTALYQAGRAAEALATYRAARTVLADAFGLDPSPALTALHRRILAQDPTLLAY